MKTMNHNLRTSALPAIAAALALSSTSAFAQQAQPVPADPPTASPAVEQPAPASQAEPAASDTSAAAPAAEAPASGVKTASTSAAKTVKRTVRTAHTAAKAPVAKPVARTHVASRSVTTHTALPAAALPAAALPAPAPATQTSQSAVKPLVNVNANPAPTPTTVAKPVKKHDDMLPIAGGALAFLAIGGAAVALTRRRHEHEEEWVEEGAAEPLETPESPSEPVVHAEEPAMIAPAASAFSWSEREGSRETARRNEDAAGDDDRLPGETWVQRAYRGPSANNPSVSLRARLKRAAFFDKRERDVAAGTAEPVDMDAGLPEAMVEEKERELA